MDQHELKDRSRYLTGGFLCLIASVMAFMPVLLGWPRPVALMIIGTSGFLQLVVQFYAFLHIDLSKERRFDLYLILFSILQVAIMFGGTLWVMYNLAHRMH